jgi:hypothetical protein
VVRLRVLVAQMLDVGPGMTCGEWSREHSGAQGARRQCDDQALADGGGEESHR